MKQASPELLALLAAGVTTLCRLWRITARGRPTLYFTDCDRDLRLGGEIYKSSKSFTTSAIQNSIGGARSNFELSVILGGDIARHDVEQGIYDGAEVNIDLCSYKDLDAGVMPIFVGTVRSVSIPLRQLAIFACYGTTGKMQRQLTEEYSPTCRADFGDSRCAIDIELHSAAITVGTVSSLVTFTAPVIAAEDDGHYSLGSLLWATGANAGIAVEVAETLEGGTVTLFIRTPFPIEPGDTATIYRGCPKTVAACTAYDNILNFRGEPYVPGNDFARAPTVWEPPADPSAAYSPPGVMTWPPDG